MVADDKLVKRKESEVSRREGRPEYYQPAVDISETEHEVVLKYDMPGVDKKDIEITAEKNNLTVLGNVKVETYSDAVYQETRVGNYRRQFTLPDDVYADSINAEMKDGVLTIRITKPEETKPKRIEITSG